MKVKVNGKEMELSTGITVSGLLEQLEVDAKAVVVEVNLEIPKREQWTILTLNPFPTALSPSPREAVVFPLPFPV